MGLADGTIDIVATDHAPHPAEDKECEWAGAANGMIGLETALSVVQKTMVDTGLLNWSQVADRMSITPAKIGRATGQGIALAVGAPANICIYDPSKSKVVVAEIISAEQHPDADRLRVCRVNAGPGFENLQIVCGAPNARAGIKIPCALVGAELSPAEEGGKPFQIKVGKLRGVESNGMLCSGRELGLGEDHAGILELPVDAPLGQNIREYLKLDDQIFTIKLTPNKAD
jgi:phenylalanyl-tRNA synthetase beta chain